MMHSIKHSFRTSLLVLAMLTGLSCVAQAQVELFVNGDPITSYDISQRQRLMQLQSPQKPPSRQDVINELIDDKLKVQIGKRYNLDMSAADIDSAYANMARRMRQTPDQFAKGLQAQGLDPQTLKSRLKADMTWNQIVRGKFSSSLQIGDRDIASALTARGSSEDVGYDYALRPILFVIPRGAPESMIETRKREAEAFRARFSGCDETVTYARAMRDVVVRDMVHRNSSDLSAPLRQAMDQVQIGKITPPEVTQGGVEVFVLCGKTSTTAETPGKREVREELYQNKFQEQAKRYLAQLRKAAMIEYKK